MFRNSKKELTTFQELNEYYADKAMAKTPPNGRIQIRDRDENNYFEVTEDHRQIYKDAEGRSANSEITTFLENNGYMEAAPSGDHLRFTQIGKIAKDLKSHKAYTKYRKREINALKHQRLINWGLFVFAGLAVIVPSLLEQCNKCPCDKSTPVELYPSVNIHADTLILDSGLNLTLPQNKSIQLPLKSKLQQLPKQETP